MADVFNDTKLVRNTTEPKYHTADNPKLTVHTTIIESFIISPGEHSILSQLAEAGAFQDAQLRKGRGQSSTRLSSFEL